MFILRFDLGKQIQLLEAFSMNEFDAANHWGEFCALGKNPFYWKIDVCWRWLLLLLFVDTNLRLANPFLQCSSNVSQKSRTHNRHIILSKISICFITLWGHTHVCRCTWIECVFLELSRFVHGISGNPKYVLHLRH